MMTQSMSLKMSDSISPDEIIKLFSDHGIKTKALTAIRLATHFATDLKKEIKQATKDGRPVCLSSMPQITY